MVELCRNADPLLTRSTFVATSVRDKMQEFFSREDAEAFLRGPARPDATFAVELTGLSGSDQGSQGTSMCTRISFHWLINVLATEASTGASPVRRRAVARPAREPSATNFVKVSSKFADTLEGFFALLSDKDTMIKRNFQNLDVSEKYLYNMIFSSLLTAPIGVLFIPPNLSNPSPWRGEF